MTYLRTLSALLFLCRGIAVWRRASVLSYPLAFFVLAISNLLRSRDGVDGVEHVARAGFQQKDMCSLESQPARRNGEGGAQ